MSAIMPSQNKIPIHRIVVLALWPAVTIYICADILLHDIYGLLSLVTLGVLATWAANTSRRWIRCSIAIILFAVIIFSELNQGPIARQLVRHDPNRDKGFLEGVNAMCWAMEHYHPYVIVAAIGLFALSISSAGKDEKTGV